MAQARSSFTAEDTEQGEEGPGAVHGEVVRSDGSMDPWISQIMAHNMLPVTTELEPSAI